MTSRCLEARFSLGLSLLLVLALLLGGLPPVQARPDTLSLLATALEPVAAEDSTSLPAGVPADWWAIVQEDMRRSEYYLTWQDQTYLPDLPAAYQAPNRAHNLRTYFTSEGPVVIPRVWAEGAETPPWRWGLRLAAWGREGASQPVQAATLHVEANRVEYRRGEVVEWYVNDEQGLEHGFTLNAPPRSGKAASGAWIVLKMDLYGDLNATLNSSASAIELTTSGGVGVIHYGELAAVDAIGRELPVRFTLDGKVVGILVDTSRAVYPINIDPLATSPNWTAEGNQDGAFFGFPVGTAGDVNGDGYADVIIGAHGYDNGQLGEGAAFVFHGSSNGLGTTAAWMAESNQAGANFAHSVATAGDVNGDGYADVIIGARYYDNGQDMEGLACVYHGSATGLDLNGTRPSGNPSNADWTGESNQNYARFGWSVATAGDVNGDGYADVVVGARTYENDDYDEGAAFVYHGSAAGLGSDGTPQNADWAAEGNQQSSEFGWSVATAGDVNGDGYADVVVGAPYYDVEVLGQTYSNVGKGYVYYGSATGLSSSPDWTGYASVVQQDGVEFGHSVATAGDVNGDGYSDVVIGAPGYDWGQTDEGKAYVYLGSASGLRATPSWSVESDQADAELGRVAPAGDVNGDGYADVIVGASGYSSGQTGEGKAFVYLGSTYGLSATAAWSVESDQADANLGQVATAGDVNGDGYSDVIVGAPRYDNGQTDEGRTYAYFGSASGLSTAAGWSVSGQSGSYFSLSLGTAGDVNGDGYADVIIGAEAYDNGQSEEGAAFVYHGSATGLSTLDNWRAESNLEDARFGTSVATAGDVNGDGYADVIVGAPEYVTNPATEWGAAFVYHGSATGLSTSPDWRVVSHVYSGPFGGHFGSSVATAGDVNGDGYADVIVGAPNVHDGWGYHGWAHVYRGSADGLKATADWSVQQYSLDENWFGDSVGTAGDVNGDGYADVIVGAFKYENGEEEEGAAFVYHGSAAGLSANPDWAVESNSWHDWFGYAVGTAGDVNGDGYADVIVLNIAEDWASVYYGSATGLSSSADWTSERNSLGPWAKEAVGTAGDVNGDGYADVIVGASGYGQVNEGAAFVYHGSATGLSTRPNWRVESGQGSAEFGCAVGSAGDVNGDGYADVIVGSPYSFGAHAYYGNGGPGLSLNPRQRRSDNSAPIAHLGMSDSDDSFRLALRGRTPFGRGKVKLQWEVKPLGTLFDGTGAQESATWVDIGAQGAVLNNRVGGLATGTAYHWRVRLHYHPATTPFQQYSRWLTMPWNGWQEQDLRTGSPNVVYLPLALRAYP
jgi:hypothetical protein